jgi:hypothetical protein
MGQQEPGAITLEWLEIRYGCGAAQEILDQMHQAENIANDAFKPPVRNIA